VPQSHGRVGQVCRGTSSPWITSSVSSMTTPSHHTAPPRPAPFWPLKTSHHAGHARVDSIGDFFQLVSEQLGRPVDTPMVEEVWRALCPGLVDDGSVMDAMPLAMAVGRVPTPSSRCMCHGATAFWRPPLVVLTEICLQLYVTSVLIKKYYVSEDWGAGPESSRASAVLRPHAAGCLRVRRPQPPCGSWRHGRYSSRTARPTCGRPSRACVKRSLLRAWSTRSTVRQRRAC
jgi:hypothetical protein